MLQRLGLVRPCQSVPNGQKGAKWTPNVGWEPCFETGGRSQRGTESLEGRRPICKPGARNACFKGDGSHITQMSTRPLSKRLAWCNRSTFASAFGSLVCFVEPRVFLL